MITAKADYLIEASWEVCNKVGGIYTVVKSKAAISKAAYHDYVLVGPYVPEAEGTEYTPEEPPAEMKKIFDELASEGIKCHYGVWEIKGSPKVILVDFGDFMKEADEIKKRLWEQFKVETLFSSGDFAPPMVWAWAVGKLVQKIGDTYSSKAVVAHFHEWLAGISLLYLKSQNSRVKTVFTTHATMLGRAIAGAGEALYSMIDHIDPYEEAKNRGILDKFTTERACANNASIFTTVSEITGLEAEKFLGRKPDVLLLNGLDIEKFPTFEETSVKHIVTRSVIREFLTYYFFPYYTFNLDHTLHFFIVGRYEFKNKGIDIMIKSLARLNERLKLELPERTVSAFFFIPSETHGIRTELLENKTFYQHIKDWVQANSSQIMGKITQHLVSGKNITENSIFTKDFLLDNKKHFLRFKRSGQPGLTTHNINDNDALLQLLRDVGLTNKQEDRVKVIHYPVYLTGTDGLLDLSYYDAIAGCHLGIFPSYYEPWGYTPLESAALGVPAVTSDMAGYGRFMEQYVKADDPFSGLKILKRLNVTENEEVEQLTTMLFNFAKHNRHERIKNKLDAKRLSKLADWEELFSNYIEAHNRALAK